MSASIDDLPLRISRRIVADERSGCWIWTGGTAGKGRPYMHWDGGMAYAYRVTYHLLVDRTLQVRGAGHTECLDHVADRCRYRPNCVNPDHLERVPWAENVRRCARPCDGAHMRSIEMLDREHDGFDGVRVVLVDVVPCKTGPRKGQPNWRQAKNRETRLMSRAELDQLAVEWGKRTGNCVPCTGSGQQFVRWDHIEGTTWRPCTACAGTGRREGTHSDRGGEG